MNADAERRITLLENETLSIYDLIIETKRDLRGEIDQLRGELTEFRTEVRGELTEFRGELTEFRTEVRGELTEVRGELTEILRRLPEPA